MDKRCSFCGSDNIQFRYILTPYFNKDNKQLYYYQIFCRDYATVFKSNTLITMD
jgi:hypothetical protein